MTERDPHAASLVLTKLQNPIKEAFETVNNDLKAVSKTQKEFGKALDRVCLYFLNLGAFL